MPYLANPGADSTGIRVSTSPALQLTTVRPNLVSVNIEPGFSPECVHRPEAVHSMFVFLNNIELWL